MKDKDQKLIWEAYEGGDPYADWESVSTSVMEILGDYGMYEANLRPSSTVGQGVEEIKDIINKYLKATGKDHNEVYNALDQMNMEGEEEMAGQHEDDNEEMIINMRLRDMLKAARAGITWEEWQEKYAGEPAKDNVEGPINQAVKDLAARYQDSKHHKPQGNMPLQPEEYNAYHMGYDLDEIEKVVNYLEAKYDVGKDFILHKERGVVDSTELPHTIEVHISIDDPELEELLNWAKEDEE